MRTTKPTVGFNEKAGTKTANASLTTTWAAKIPTRPESSNRPLWDQKVRRSEAASRGVGHRKTVSWPVVGEGQRFL